MNIGNNIKQLRQKKKLTQEKVAAKLNVSYQAVSKWENNANTPDIAFLPEIAALFGVSVDALFSDNIADYPDIKFIKNDDVIRIVQMRGTKILKVSSVFSQDNPPIEIVFPHDCNDRTQYFKVEVYGHIISDSSINGDVKCSGSIQVNELNCQKINCNDIIDCYKLQAKTIECAGDINSANLTCNQITYKHE